MRGWRQSRALSSPNKNASCQASCQTLRGGSADTQPHRFEDAPERGGDPRGVPGKIGFRKESIRHFKIIGGTPRCLGVPPEGGEGGVFGGPTHSNPPSGGGGADIIKKTAFCPSTPSSDSPKQPTRCLGTKGI